MAVSTYTSGDYATSNIYVKMRIQVIVNSQSIANNTSNVTLRLYFRRTNQGYETYGTGTATGGIDGTTYNQAVTPSQKIVYSSGNGICLFEKSVTVSHSTDGSKSLSVTGKISIPGANLSSSTQTYTISLPTIPRASSITSSVQFYAGASLPVTVSRANSAFTHKIEVIAGGTSVKTVSGVGSSTTITFTDSQVNTLVSKASGGKTAITLKCTTYSGSSQIGSATTKTGTCLVNPSTVASSVDFIIGNPLSVTISRKISQYKHKVDLLASDTVVASIDDVDTSATLVIPAETLYNLIPNSNSLAVTVRITTKSGSATIGTALKSGTASVNQDTAKPDFVGFTFEDVSSCVNITQDNQVLVSGFSNVKVTVPANAASSSTGATISKFIVSIGDKTGSIPWNALGGEVIIQSVTSGTIAVAAVDSRGNQTVIQKITELVPYTRPVISSFSLSRINGAGSDTILTASIQIYKDPIGKGSNAIQSVTYRWKPSTSSDDDFENGITDLTPAEEISQPIMGDLEDNGFTIENSFVIELVVQDAISSTSKRVTLNSGQPLLDLYRNGKSFGIAVGKICEKDNLFDVAIPTNLLSLSIDENAVVDFIVEQGSVSGKGYYRKWNSGILEQWIRKTDSTIALTNAYGSFYIGDYYWELPVPFIDTGIRAFCGMFRWGTGASWGTVLSTSQTQIRLTGIDIASRPAGTYTQIAAYAVGSWK